MGTPNQTTSAESQEGIDIFELWKEYEKIAMHFNDLLIRLRSQALGGVAVISILVSFLSKGDVPEVFRWGFLSGTFFVLALFWVAIWCLDFLYYNRLLLGAIKEILRLEEMTETESRIKKINLSTTIEEMVVEGPPDRKLIKEILSGRCLFYSIVLFTLLAAFLFSAAQLVL